MQEQNIVFKGMKQDMHPINQDASFLFDAHNIRFSSRGDSSLMSITNEKGNTPIQEAIFRGHYMGHCIIDRYLVIFTHYEVEDENIIEDYIYRVDNKFITDILFKGNLDFDVNYPIYTIPYKESETIKKVYWVDGKNQP